MRRFLALAAGLLLTATSAFAQQGGGNGHPRKSPEDRAAAHTVRMTKDLALTPEQATKVKDLNLKNAQVVDELRPAPADKAAKMERRERAKTAYADYETQLKQILTPEQYAKHQQLQADRKEKMKARRAERGHGG